MSALATSAPHCTGPSRAIKQEIKGTPTEQEEVQCVRRERGPVCQVLPRSCTLLPNTPLCAPAPPSPFPGEAGRNSCTAPRGVCSRPPTWRRGAGTPGPGAKSTAQGQTSAPHSLAVGPWTSDWVPLCPRFLVCKTDVIASTTWDRDGGRTGSYGQCLAWSRDVISHAALSAT